MKTRSLRWLGFISCIVIIIFMTYEMFFGTGNLLGTIQSVRDCNFQYLVIVCLLPALVASLLSLFKKYWPLLIFGIWFLYFGYFSMIDKLISKMGVFCLILPALVLFFIPFINKVLSKNKNS